MQSVFQFTPHPGIVEPFNVVKYVGASISPSIVTASVDTFALEHAEESFDKRIIRRAAYGAHAADQVVTLEETLVFVAGELSPAVRVQNDA